MASAWQTIGKAKADSVLDLIPGKWRLPHIPSVTEQRDITGSYMHQHLDKKEIQITETDAVGIVKNTSTGVWTAVEVAKAFCHRAAIAHQIVSCLHEIFFDAAIAEAEQLDRYFAEHKKPIGMLHGLPISLKDQFHVKGVETHMGYIGWLGTFQGQKGTGKEKVFESEMVKQLRALGAILYCKTSVPSTLMSGETSNNIIGYTYNPKNRNLSSGGSSGGEGALLGARGSPLGMGTDIGGSIRIPSAFNGLYGLRPSSGRLPYQGMANTLDGQNTILSVVGPLATSPDALKLVFQALLSTKPWLYDPLVLEIPWRSEAELPVSDRTQRTDNGLSFGVVRHDGVVTPVPPVSRAIEMVVQALSNLGHQVIDWKPPPHTAITDIVAQVWALDGGADFKAAFALSNEECRPQIVAELRPQADASTIMALNVTKRNVQKAYMDYWNSTASLTNTGRPVDAFISPVAPFPAARPGMYKYYGYTYPANVLDYTSVVIPVTIVDKDIDKKAEHFKPVDDNDRVVQESYDPELYDGAHVSIQLVGRRLQEEKMIALAKYVSEALRV